jgi:hypothetical protein
MNIASLARLACGVVSDVPTICGKSGGRRLRLNPN